MTSSSSKTSGKLIPYLLRSLRLRCPVCGLHPLFKPIGEMRSLNDWFQTLPGCPHCKYEYDREEGYYMLALWAFDYGPAAVVGIGLLLFFFFNYQLSTPLLLAAVLLPTFIFALLIVRHAKALYLMVDLLIFHSHDEE